MIQLQSPGTRSLKITPSLDHDIRSSSTVDSINHGYDSVMIKLVVAGVLYQQDVILCLVPVVPKSHAHIKCHQPTDLPRLTG